MTRCIVYAHVNVTDTFSSQCPKRVFPVVPAKEQPYLLDTRHIHKFDNILVALIQLGPVRKSKVLPVISNTILKISMIETGLFTANGKLIANIRMINGVVAYLLMLQDHR